LSFAYTEPWFLGTDVTLSGGVRNRLRDSSYSATEFSLSGQAPIADRLKIRLGTGYDLVASLSDQPSSRTYWANSGVEFDTRDRPGNPAHGIYADLAIRAGSRQPDTLALQTVARSDLDVTGIVPLGRRFALALSGHGRNVYSPDTIYGYDLIEVGGANSLRGFKEGQFTTARCGWFTCEPRYLTSRTSRIYPFFDVAVVQDPDRGSYDWHAAYGVGLGVVTAIGTVGLDYGVATNTSPLKGKVHFSIQTSF
jgi:outer membrane protein assembly factor BamA